MKPTILLYDSGMGGLTVYDEIRKKLPNAHYLYYFDNACFPYSEKPTEVLVERATKMVQKMAKNYPLDLVVVACNTASTVVLPTLRKIFPFPIVGTVPAIKPAAALSQTKTIGLLATKGTITRPYVLSLIEQYAPNCQIEKIGSTALVELVEQKLQTGVIDLTRLTPIIADWQNHPTLDTVILGCTHFPMVKTELQQLLPNVKYFLDSGNAIANRVTHLIMHSPHNQQLEKQRENLAFCTQQNNQFKQQAKIMQRWGFPQLNTLMI
ncbi:glutamate racemase [[Haemophilus] ducreyi]|uniref:Glutamate racemase n=1 Tax=Haemophilus ducreyi TaxID=730 RepID=A0AAC8UDJ5_HAEDC|nr:glutamate racemase [[Haemophilus] ducreyi]AKO31471.1 glutamate racemase [[Haemophilus] ducreyi]AKO32926.1 glutamate racemase [[Haemophilus] ducreyi]AKO34372.1 glutamate racemase [[Haemophilus] ducreyi]AKO35817.1 glutamate racemase [[Haemophilus] ducreyi]AKO37271.1 glutamate racemase [[Haemophilus] ducreyi]